MPRSRPKGWYRDQRGALSSTMMTATPDMTAWRADRAPVEASPNSESVRHAGPERSHRRDQVDYAPLSSLARAFLGQSRRLRSLQLRGVTPMRFSEGRLVTPIQEA